MEDIFRILPKILDFLQSSFVFRQVRVRHVFETYNMAESILVQGSAISFKNIGDETVTINDVFTLSPTDPMFSIATTAPYFDVTEYRVKFAGGGTNPNLLVIRQVFEGNENSFFQETKSRI